MRRSFKILFLFIFGYITAQKKSVEKVYFDFDKFSLPSIQKKNIIDFIKNVDTTIIESAQIYGYCDDRGANDYNYKLSVNRANKVKKTLTDFGFNKNKIVIIEGRGRITLNKDTIENLVETRSKNRRVDLILVKKIN